MNPALRTSAAHVFVDSVEAPSPADDDLHHLVRVLRLRDGERVTVSDGSGNWRVTEMRSGVLVPIGEIAYFLAEDKYVVVHHDGGEVLIEESLKALEDEFHGRFVDRLFEATV